MQTFFRRSSVALALLLLRSGLAGAQPTTCAEDLNILSGQFIPAGTAIGDCLNLPNPQPCLVNACPAVGPIQQQLQQLLAGPCYAYQADPTVQYVEEYVNGMVSVCSSGGASIDGTSGYVQTRSHGTPLLTLSSSPAHAPAHLVMPAAVLVLCRWGPDSGCGVADQCAVVANYVGPLVPTVVLTLLVWGALCYKYRKERALPCRVPNSAERQEMIRELGDGPEPAHPHDCCCCGRRSLSANSSSIVWLTSVTLVLCPVLHTVGAVVLNSGMWLGAAVVYITCAAWMRNASKSWKTPRLVQRLMGLDLALAIVAGLLAVFAGSYGVTIRALCNSAGASCDAGFVSSSKKAVYDSLYAAYWLILLQMVLLTYCSAQIYMRSRAAEEIWPADAETCAGTPGDPRQVEAEVEVGAARTGMAA
jgi:hypothetical protein